MPRSGAILGTTSRALTDSGQRLKLDRRTAGSLLALGLAFALFCSLPYAIAAQRTGPSERFTGLLLHSYDQHYYLAAQRSAAENLSRANRFTSEKGAPGPVASLYPMMGRLQSVTHLPKLLVYHAPRFTAAILLPISIFLLLQACFPNRRDIAWSGTFLALFSVGIATLAPTFFDRTDAADNIPEATILYSAIVYPHFTVAYLGLAYAFLAIARTWRGPRRAITVVTAAVAGLLLAISHAFLLLPVALVLGTVAGAQLCRRHRLHRRLADVAITATAILLPALPFLVSLSREQTRFEALQGHPFPLTPSAEWWTWILAYPILMLLILFAAVDYLRVRDESPEGSQPSTNSTRDGVFFLALWIGTQGALIFLPFTPFQRRFSEGLIIPLSGLAAFGFARLAPSDIGLRSRLRLRLRGLIVAILVAGSCITVLRAGRAAEYRPTALTPLFDQIHMEDVVLAGDTLSEELPAFSSGTVFLGRTTETLRYGEKLALRQELIEHPQSLAAITALVRAGVNLILVDDGDSTFSADLGFFEGRCQERSFRVGAVRGFRISRPCAERLGTG
jgi:hypothetical protein